MDVHRCRFVAYNPQAINALAFSHPPSPEISGRGVPTLRLAIGRANGDIEIWNPLRGAWLQESILRGGKDRSIEGVVWTQDPSEDAVDSNGFKAPGKLRLFSIGSSSVVTEWNLGEGRPARHSSGNFGEIWCLAAQPRWKPTKKDKDGKFLPPAEGEYTGQHLAVGCADGSVVILSTEDGDLRYLRSMRPSTKKARVLSLTFQDRNTAVVGYADSSIRIFDIRNGRILRTVSMGKGPVKGSKELLVWCVKCLPDGTIISGDSAGEIRFWDAKNYSLIQRIQGHQADVLDIAVSADGESLISGGADQRTTVYKLGGSNKNDKSRRWKEITHRRYHTHDIKAFAVYETKDISIVVSGGLDTIPVVVPLREYGAEHHRKLSNLPQIPQIASSPSSRLLMSWWEREINIWYISKHSGAGEQLLDGTSHKLVGKVLFQGEESLTSAALSSDGKLFVAATIAEVKMFSLTWRKGDSKPALRVQKIDLPPAVAIHGAKSVTFSPNSQWICLIRANNDINLARIVSSSNPKENPQILSQLIDLDRIPRHIRHKEIYGTLGQYERSIRCVVFSEDSRILACGDIGGFIDSWILEDVVESRTDTRVKANGQASSDDEFSDGDDAPVVLEGQRWIQTPSESPIPRLKAGILLLSFRPSNLSRKKSLTNGTTNSHFTRPSLAGTDRLMILTADHQLSEFELLKGKLSDWSRRNPKAYLPNEFTILKDRAMGAFWDVNRSRERFWLYGPTWMWMFNLSQDFPPPDGAAENKDSPGAAKQRTKKRKRDDEEGKLPKTNTGAGDRMPLSKSDVGMGRKMRKIVGDEEANAQWIDLKPERTRDDAIEEDEYEPYNDSSAANDSALARLRREQSFTEPETREREGEDGGRDKETNHQGQRHANGTSTTSPSSSIIPSTKSQIAFAVVIINGPPVAKGDNALPKGKRVQSQKSKMAVAVPEKLKREEQASVSIQNATDADSVPDLQVQAQEPSKNSPRERRWWHTHKYRDVLGIVPLDQLGSGSDVEQEQGEDGFNLEVAVVERPMWDVDLPGRYVRDYE
ncbi:small nucleolar ribonucleoprotein complex subunit [Histoplasma capsulatum var. duboisii H88]|uniref:Small nucleolar ribonucleoprotein complex subunit n=1 Tax=Ajellomyces capsulatus (strain H88) TaxID=544711 RepID=F0US23_AJEC8|nr:small nucleolar ribonucleoprotein complex subunit [Histoplasma capsulatum var. duboisii H88]QSS50708.1 small nucleolar ribonucleoprotein complex subunit [Histoplasma capsulatum var. duboisii H88]